MSKTIIFTDLDGTLLHPKTYLFDAALPALELIHRKNIPLVFCSSKTRAEIELWRERLGNLHPFISENGGGIFIPEGYFPFPVEGEAREGYRVISLGAPYEEIRRFFTALRGHLHIEARGFGDMTPEEISDITGLKREEAALAQAREFDEPFVFEEGADARFLRAVEERGFRWTQGRFFHVMGQSDKGKAVRILNRHYEKESGKIVSIALGDGFNDLPLLQEADHPVLIPKEDGNYDPRVDFPGLIRVKGIGPAGWNEAVLKLIR